MGVYHEAKECERIHDDIKPIHDDIKDASFLNDRSQKVFVRGFLIVFDLNVL